MPDGDYEYELEVDAPGTYIYDQSSVAEYNPKTRRITFVGAQSGTPVQLGTASVPERRLFFTELDADRLALLQDFQLTVEARRVERTEDGSELFKDLEIPSVDVRPFFGPRDLREGLPYTVEVPEHVYGWNGDYNDTARLNGTSLATPQVAG